MKAKTVYLILIIAIFIFLRIPFFENAWIPKPVYFFGGTPLFTSIYPRILFLGMIEWVIVTLFIQKVLKDIKYQEPTKFDLNQ